MLVLSASCTTPGPLFSARLERAENSARLSLGRLRVGVPAGFSRRDAETSTTGVEVWTEALEGPPEAAWARALAALPSGAERERLDWSDGVRAVIWERGNDRYLQVMKPFDDHVVWLLRDYPEPKRAIAEKLLRELVRVYAPGSRDGFAVEHGAFQRVAQLENARLSLVGPSDALRLRLISRSTVAAEVRDPAAIAAEVRAVGGTFELLRARRRTVAGLDGDELVMRLSSRDLEPQVRFEWAHRGAPSNRDPGLSLEAIGPASSAATLEQAWEQLLDSLEVELPP